MWGTVCSEPSNSRTNAQLLSGKAVRQSKTTYVRGGREKSQIVLFILRMGTEGSKTNQRDKGLAAELWQGSPSRNWLS